MATKPTKKPDWTDGDAAKITEPSAAKKLLGYTSSEKPSSKEMNWNFHYNALWIDYLEQVTDEAAALQNVYDAIVGIGGTHADINAVMADMDGVTLPTQDVKIFVKTALTLNTTQVVDKEGVLLEFHPQALVAKGTAVLGLQIDAKRFKVLNGRFMNFSAVSDKAIELTANATNGFIKNNTFFNNDTEIDDALGSNNIITDNLVEV